MSATRAPQLMTPCVGLFVRIDRTGDPADGLIGRITDLRGRIARVDFDRSDHIARWFTFTDLVDEFISRTEHVTSMATSFVASGAAVVLELQTDHLDSLERASCRPLSRT